MRQYSQELSRILWIASGALCIGSAPALAQTLTGDLDVQIIIEAECELGTINAIDFGTQGVLTEDVDAAGSIAVTCTPGLDYALELNEGDGVGASEATRLMTGTLSTATVEYSLYTNPGRTDLWGSDTDAVEDTGTGSTVVYDVYGRVGIQATPAPDTYTDTVTVSLTY